MHETLGRESWTMLLGYCLPSGRKGRSAGVTLPLESGMGRETGTETEYNENIVLWLRYLDAFYKVS